MRAARYLAFGLALAAFLFWFLTRPSILPAGEWQHQEPDLANGEQLFWVGGCASCHAAAGSEGDERLKLGGGLELQTAFGSFFVPNISPDPVSGIGGWSVAEFVNAMKNGVSPDGRHYYPSFPYTSYTRMTTADLVDLKAFLDTLPALSGITGAHELTFPYTVRRALGLWKLLFLDPAWVTQVDSGKPDLQRGRYLVEGPGHCAECHTPRGWIGGLLTRCWLAGAPNPDGEGTVPNITPHGDGLSGWSRSDIAYYLESGFTPDFDTVGGSMVEVQENLAMLGDTDRKAMAAYLNAVPALADACGGDDS
jgi:mono/diheme cytochrome c family protein